MPAPARGEATPPPFWGLLGCPPMPRAPPRGLTVRWTEIQTPGPTVLPATWDFLEMARLGSTRGAERLRAGLGTGTLQWGGSPGVALEWQRWTQRGSPPSSPSGPALGFILFPTPASSEACLESSSLLFIAQPISSSCLFFPPAVTVGSNQPFSLPATLSFLFPFVVGGLHTQKSNKGGVSLSLLYPTDYFI